ncbi:glycosyltransferase family 2 protein [Patescibacteria group bacterium]
MIFKVNPKVRFSVAIAAFNEAENIGDCLKSLQGVADEVVVVDGSSTDQTRFLARKLGARVIKTTNPPMFHINKNKAIDACLGEWILVLDADERISPELGKEIRAVVEKKAKKGDPSGYWLKRKNLFLGRYLKKGGQYPDPVIRLFKKGRGYHPAESVHEQIEIKGRVGWLKNDLIHRSSPTFARYLKRFKRYTTLEAGHLKKAGVKIGPKSAFIYLFGKPNLTFWSLFLLHRGFVDGFPGFVFALFSGLHWFVAYLKHWQRSYSSEVAGA